jgi:hypothetical protein
LKIDVQGFELAVLKGALKALQDTLVVHTEARECDGLYSCGSEVVMLGSEYIGIIGAEMQQAFQKDFSADRSRLSSWRCTNDSRCLRRWINF